MYNRTYVAGKTPRTNCSDFVFRSLLTTLSAIGYLIAIHVQFLPLPHDVTSLWNMVEVIPLFIEEVGQLGTGDTFVSCARREQQCCFGFGPVWNTDCPFYNLIDY
jgi:hypothetical protein